MPAEFPSRICQIIARKQWMSCRKYAEKRREYGELHGGRYRGAYRRRLRNGRGTQARGIWKGGPRKRARGSRRSGKESWLERAEIARVRNGAGTRQKVGYWGEPKEPYARRGRDEPRTRGLGASAEVRTKKQRRESCAEGDPKTRGCGTGAGAYEQAGTRARTKDRAEGAEGKLGGGCFAFLIGLKHVSAILSSRKTPFVDKNRRYVSHFRAGRSRGPRRFRKRPGHSFSPSERVFSLE